MKRIVLTLLLIVVIISIVSCKNETVGLHCDGDGCENIVEVKIRKDETPDENWVIFCEECAKNELAD